MNSKKIGVIVEVDGIYAKVGMYNETNEAEFLWNGEILTGPKVGAYLTINQGMVKIIATVFSEKIIDNQNSANSDEFNNTFSKNTINRIISLKVKGVINNNKFSVSSEYVPMIGNIVSLTTKKELNIIYGLSDNTDTILIGKSLLEEYPIYLPINTIFASHIGIFGNTGSGKSNTLHKLYLELFKSKYIKKINKVSQFYVIDFNGEYTQENQFGLSSQYKRVFKINTRIESVSAWKSTNIEHINPLFKRIETSILSLEKVIEVVDNVEDTFKMLNVISLLDANQEITRLIPMLISKMIYDEQKNQVSNDGEVKKTKHLIIDEAHNILNSQFRRNGDDWQDYRLSIFEEIIKEGRKFGFYLTLSSQRPADISPTIMSQLHNYFIHRLVNDNDLEMLKNTMPTLDGYSFNMIPNLGQGEAVITGNSIKVPLLIKVNKETIIRPNSDDVILTSLWK